MSPTQGERKMRIKQRRRYLKETETFSVSFLWPGGLSGFTFPCDAEGNVGLLSLHPEARRNYLDCSTGAIGVKRQPVSRHIHREKEPAIGICDCGSEVVLQGFTCTCHGCGADYNSAGQKLAPRSQWGCETGESVADILAVDHTELEDFEF